MAKSLRSLAERRDLLARQQAVIASRQKAAQHWKLVRTTCVAALVLGLGLTLIWFFQRSAKVRWARERALPEITRLAKDKDSFAAFSLAQQAEKYIPSDPALTNLWPQISVRATIETTPVGADVYLKEYRKPDSEWQYLGKSPMKNLRVARGFYRWQIKKEGYASVERAARVLPDPTLSWLGGTNHFSLDAAHVLPPGMVRVEGGRTRLGLVGLARLELLQLEDYFIDKYEVSNRQFKDFIDRGGMPRPIIGSSRS